MTSHRLRFYLQMLAATGELANSGASFLGGYYCGHRQALYDSSFNAAVTVMPAEDFKQFVEQYESLNRYCPE